MYDRLLHIKENSKTITIINHYPTIVYVRIDGGEASLDRYKYKILPGKKLLLDKKLMKGMRSFYRRNSKKFDYEFTSRTIRGTN